VREKKADRTVSINCQNDFVALDFTVRLYVAIVVSIFARTNTTEAIQSTKEATDVRQLVMATFCTKQKN
jgi:translation elongation factor EF-Ts